MALSTMEWFKVTLLMMLFYSFAINILIYSMPDEALPYVKGFSDLAGEISLEGVSEDVQDSVQEQTNIPVLELGALVFYSGNILIDLILNFAFAIPEMAALVLTGVLMLLNIDTQIANIMQLFFSVTIMVMYFIGIIQLLTGIRSGRIVG